MLKRVEHYLALSAKDLVDERLPEMGEDVHFTAALVETMVERFTSAGDVVLDPFAGFGTTLVVGQRMGREVVGVELLPERVELIQRRLRGGGRIVEGDARRLAELDIGPVDLCLTSPPYMTAVDHPENPLMAYETNDGDYPRYLTELAAVFATVGRLLRPGGHLVINAANLLNGAFVTPLAWDIARVVGEHLAFRGEVYLHWDRPPPDITGDYCLVFQADR